MSLLTSQSSYLPPVPRGSEKISFRTLTGPVKVLALFCALTAIGRAQEFRSAAAAYEAYRRIYEQNDATALAVYAEEGVIRFLDEKSGKSNALPLGMYKTLIQSMIPGALAKGEHVVFSQEPELAQTGDNYSWRGVRTTYPDNTILRYIVDIRKTRNGSFQVEREVLLTPR
jgi:hypothetical protein